MATLDSEDRKRRLIAFEEDKEIITLIDEIASQEGSNRSAIIRRMIRLGLAATDPQKPMATLTPLSLQYQH